MKRKLTLTAISTLLWSAGCAEMPSDETTLSHETGAATSSENGLKEINGLNAYNGLNSYNGLSVYNGLNSYNGLQSYNGLMSTFSGRILTSYLIKCALPAGRSISKQDQSGAWYTYQGAVGAGPGWENGNCDTSCQQAVSACVLAHVNTAGVHIPLWLDSPISSIGWGQSSTYPNQEGTYFGNIFAPNPSTGKVDAFYCNGPSYTRSVVPGRLGGYEPNTPYTNPFGMDTQCAGHCVAADSPNNNDGYKSCNGYNAPVTVWRQNAPAFNAGQTYKICSKFSGRCLDEYLSGTGDGVQIIQWDYVGNNNQKWYITPTSGGFVKITNKNSGKVVDVSNDAAPTTTKMMDGALIHQWTYGGYDNQQWAISPVGGGYYSIVDKMTAKSLDVKDWNNGNGAYIQQWYYWGQDNQQWVITAVP